MTCPATGSRRRPSWSGRPPAGSRAVRSMSWSSTQGSGESGLRSCSVARDGSTLVGPDNGVLLPLAEHLGGVAASFRIDPDRRGANRRVGTTFDGRDVFAPAAALLARGIPASRLGRPIDPIVYRVPDAVRISGGARGKIVHVDRFGNLITNVPSEWVLPRAGQLRLTVGRRSRIVPWVRSYEALGPRRVGALGSSFGTLEVAVREGSAAVRLAARTGTRVSVVWAPGASRATEMVNSVRPTVGLRERFPRDRWRSATTTRSSGSRGPPARTR